MGPNPDITFPYDLDAFLFERILEENPNFHFLIVLGTFPNVSVSPPPTDDSVSVLNAPHGENYDMHITTTTTTTTTPAPSRLPAILRIERTAFAATFCTDHLSTGIMSSTKLLGHTDIYSWAHGWLDRRQTVPDVKITVICPATEVHIQKYTKQERIMVTETPELYQAVVRPFMDAFPASRTQWVRDILQGRAEADAVLCRTSRFIIFPDMKWDPSGPVTSLYLLAIATDPAIRSLRDLRGGPDGHVEMLEEIQDRTHEVVKARWGLRRGAVRMYIHYQPSYYHFHVHIVHAAQDGTMGMTVGQAHLLDDVISMLKHSPNILSELTLTYGLGSQHGLFEAMVAVL